MKKKLLIIVLVIFFSCEKDKKNKIANEPTPISTNEVLVSEAVVIIDTVYSASNTIEDYCIALENLKSEFQKKINENSSKENNNSLYEEYKLIRNAHIKNLNETNADLLSKYVNFYDEDKEDFVIPKDVKKIENQLKAVDVVFRYIGEGYTENINKPEHFFNLFKGKVTQDYEDYIKQFAIQNKETYSMDAGIQIPFSEVGDRAVFWENFLSKHKKSKLYSRAKNQYNIYLKEFILGEDNTPTVYDNESEPVYIEIYKEFIEKYPNSKVTKKVKELIDLVAKKMTYDEIREKMKFEKIIWEDE